MHVHRANHLTLYRWSPRIPPALKTTYSPFKQGKSNTLVTSGWWLTFIVDSQQICIHRSLPPSPPSRWGKSRLELQHRASHSTIYRWFPRIPPALKTTYSPFEQGKSNKLFSCCYIGLMAYFHSSLSTNVYALKTTTITPFKQANLQFHSYSLKSFSSSQLKKELNTD